MDQNTQEKIKQRINELPEDVRQAITSVDTSKTISSIAQKYKLLIDQGDMLYTEIFLALLGFEETGDLPKNISRNVGISEESARLMTADINNAIFLPIRTLLRKIQESIEKNMPSTESQDRSQILDAIENPVPTKPTTSIAQMPERELVKRTTTDNFLAQKMSPNVTPSQNTSTSPIQKKYVEDPYREPIK